MRPVCSACGAVFFLDPKVVAGVITELDGRVVMIRRNLEPGLGRWTFPAGFVDRGEVVEEAAAREVKEETGVGPIDDRALKDMFGDAPEMFKEILNDFVTPSQVIISEIQAGWKERCAEDIKQAAHKLKSSAMSIGATELADVCQSLETAGKEEDWKLIDESVPNLDHLMGDVEGYINGLS